MAMTLLACGRREHHDIQNGRYKRGAPATVKVRRRDALCSPWPAGDRLIVEIDLIHCSSQLAFRRNGKSHVRPHGPALLRQRGETSARRSPGRKANGRGNLHGSPKTSWLCELQQKRASSKRFTKISKVR